MNKEMPRYIYFPAKINFVQELKILIFVQRLNDRVGTSFLEPGMRWGTFCLPSGELTSRVYPYEGHENVHSLHQQVFSRQCGMDDYSRFQFCLNKIILH